MKNFLTLLIVLITFSGFSQSEEDFNEDDTFELITEYQLLDYTARTFLNFTPTEENIEWDNYTKVIYNPIVNNEVLDSIIKWRVSKGYSDIQVDWVLIDKKMRDQMYFEGMDVSKAESEKITLGRFEDYAPDCDCVTDIVTNILDDSLIYVEGNHERVFTSYLLDEKIKRIEIYYHQVYNESKKIEENHLTVKIRKKFRLFTYPYQIF
jgi:hypothetical protein